VFEGKYQLDTSAIGCFYKKHSKSKVMRRWSHFGRKVWNG